MADALVSPPVALVAGAAAATLVVVAAREMKFNRRDNIVPLMGVMGAFIFAAQMLNFSIPGTGSSGHIVGGVLLAALLGPWAGFLTLASVLVIQCLVFADGGLLALGCNIVNMGAMTCLVAYPLVFRPLVRRGMSGRRLLLASLAACVAGLLGGALLVVAETELSGITALPWREFMLFMLPIHLAIGICEGLATAAVLAFVARTRPDLIVRDEAQTSQRPRSSRRLIVVFAVAAVVMGGGLAFFASPDPDGLEWSVDRVTGSAGVPDSTAPAARQARDIQEKTSLMPDYSGTLSGIVGSVIVLLLVWGATSLLVRRRRADSR